MSIVDVAKRAGVSVATFSRVINDFPGVSPRTARQVRTAMKELLYVPAPIRPGPKPGSRRTTKARVRVGSMVVLTVGQTSRDWLTLPMMASIFAGITAAAVERGLRLMVDEMADLRKPSELITGRQVDGAIVFWSSHIGAGKFELLHGHGVPMVRLMGAIEGVAEVYRPRVQTAGTLEELVDKLAARKPRPTGLFSSTDRLTLKLYPLLESRGMFPGEDIQIVSCDNQEAMLSHLRPRPASVDL